MNNDLAARLEHTADILSQTLATAENIVSFYEEYLQVVNSENELLVKENARLRSLLANTPKKTAPPAFSWRNRLRPTH